MPLPTIPEITVCRSRNLKLKLRFQQVMLPETLEAFAAADHGVFS